MSIPIGASGKDAELLINLFSAAGVAITGFNWTTSTGLYVCLPGAAYAAASSAQLARVVEKGRGRYALQLSAGETATSGVAQLDLDPVALSCLAHSQSDDIRDLSTGTALAAIPAAVLASVIDGIALSLALTRVLRFVVGKRSGQSTNTTTIRDLGDTKNAITITTNPVGGVTDAWTAVEFND